MTIKGHQSGMYCLNFVIQFSCFFRERICERKPCFLSQVMQLFANNGFYQSIQITGQYLSASQAIVVVIVLRCEKSLEMTE